MDVRLLGTGSPVPHAERAGTALLLTIEGEHILIDCGPNAVDRLLKERIDIAGIETLFFTHHHVDHNADFYSFVIGSWTMGRERLDIYGPSGTTQLLESLYSVYEEDLEYRSQLDYSSEGIYGIDVFETTNELIVETPEWVAQAQAVDHSIETYAYRFEERSTDTSVVFSGDTAFTPDLVEFASKADVLIQDACIGPVRDDPPTEGVIWDRLTEPYPEERLDVLRQTHCSATQAGQIAADANVDHLVLTHLLPYRDTKAMREQAEAEFDGRVTIAEDRIHLEP
jgi:ribonuclease BN (tRNA processing enzyme)